MGIEDAIVESLAHRTGGAVLVEVDVSQAGGHGASEGKRGFNTPLTSRSECGGLPVVSRRVNMRSPKAVDAGPVSMQDGASGVDEDVELVGDEVDCEHPDPTADASPLPLLPRDRTLRGTVWIPRILWALEWSRREGRPPSSAADIARVLTEHGGLDVSGHNVARAFRDFRKDGNGARLWVSAGRGYEITTAGRRALEALLADDGGA